MATTVWYDVISELTKALENCATFVKAGAIDFKSVKMNEDDGLICIIRDHESEKLQSGSFVGDGSSSLDIIVENWVKNSDQDFLVGYELLATQEADVRKALVKWAHAAKHDFDLVYVEIGDTYGDTDSQRPFLGSRMQLQVKYNSK